MVLPLIALGLLGMAGGYGAQKFGNEYFDDRDRSQRGDRFSGYLDAGTREDGSTDYGLLGQAALRGGDTKFGAGILSGEQTFGQNAALQDDRQLFTGGQGDLNRAQQMQMQQMRESGAWGRQQAGFEEATRIAGMQPQPGQAPQPTVDDLDSPRFNALQKYGNFANQSVEAIGVFDRALDRIIGGDELFFRTGQEEGADIGLMNELQRAIGIGLIIDNDGREPSAQQIERVLENNGFDPTTMHFTGGRQKMREILEAGRAQSIARVRAATDTMRELNVRQYRNPSRQQAADDILYAPTAGSAAQRQGLKLEVN